MNDRSFSADKLMMLQAAAKLTPCYLCKQPSVAMVFALPKRLGEARQPFQAYTLCAQCAAKPESPRLAEDTLFADFAN